MIARVTRLVRAEFIKLFAHPFFYLSLAALALAAVLAQDFLPAFFGQKETVWRSFNSIQLFSYGFRFGIKIATLVLLVFSGMAFSGEFDRGTIKNLLTRPVTRTDFFLAKVATVTVLGTFLFVFVLYVNLAYALGRGDLGPVWDSDHYLIQREYEVIAAFARKAVLMSFLPLLAAGFLGLLVSNWTESSGYAVAIALVLYLFGEWTAGMFSQAAQQKTFFYYGAYALDKLQLYAGGGTEYWDKRIEEGLLYLKVPLLYMAVFIPAAYGIFRSRDIHA